MPDFRMPDIGEGLTEAEIVQWHVAIGDEVTVDQIIVEVETAKTVVEIPSPYTGVITGIVAEPGDTVEVGDILFVVGDSDEPAADSSSPTGADRSTLNTQRSTTETQQADPSSVRAMPLVRRLAAERGIDLATVVGTGPGGAITRADVENAEPAATFDGVLMPLSPTRRAIAEHMAESWRTIPHVTVQAEVRAERLLEEMKAEGIGLEAAVARRVVPLLDDFRDFNAAFTDDGVARYTSRDIGFAVDTEAGLMVVVVRGADGLSPTDIHEAFESLAAKAKDRTISLDDISGQTFTISNIGALGGGHGTPIIPLGTTAILSIGRATQQPVIVNGSIEIGLVAPIDVSYDHRVIDGGLGQRFLSSVVAALEE